MLSDNAGSLSKTNVHQILKQFWGFDSFRPLQKEIILSVMDGRDTLAIMPTGGGKSLCYQVPGLAMDGTCLVISPLIALMKDQVENLRRKNMTAFAVYSGMQRKEVLNIMKLVTESNCKFLFVSPERLETALFKEYLPGMGISLIAVDEAHCISQWGYDFRPPYLRIAALRGELPGVPVLALTASATAEVEKDICYRLTSASESQEVKERAGSPSSLYRVQPSGWNFFRQSFERPNLSYSVFKVESKINKIAEIINKVPGSGIVYCRSRKRCREISEMLTLHQVSADYYHAGLMHEERNRKQEEWIKNKTRIIVCTNAFGMGIDKPDVRTVIHADIPDCLENYYQEAGRAGRDSKKSYAVLLYDDQDLGELEKLPEIRFPGLKTIRSVYQAVANYLQLEAGAGMGQYFDFDFSDFLKKFKLNSHEALYSLKALEQENFVSFHEQIFRPATVEFTVNKDYLYRFEKENPALEPLVKSLLRSYEGIFDQPVFISERVLAQLLKKNADEVEQELHRLKVAGIIDYIPRKDNPQLYFPVNRVKSDDLLPDLAALQKRKEIYLGRVKQMMSYAREQGGCRSQMIGFYFGDSKLPDCGVCDNCLRRKATELTHEEFDMIHKKILNLLASKPIHAKELTHQLDGIKKEKAWKVIEFLQAERKIRMDEEGRVSLG